MKAAYREQYGPAENLEIREMEVPSPKPREILVRVKATTVNRTDTAVLTGSPFAMRFFTGLFKPRRPITGTDFAGEIESIGDAVTHFQVGDKVMGFQDQGFSSHANYLCIAEDKPLQHIPSGFTFPQAAASLEGAHYAYNFLNKVSIEPNQKVFINGATGAIGSALLQMVKAKGAHITATCKGKHFELMESLGADELIDYTTTDFTKSAEKYDFVLDAVGKSSYFQCRHLLKPRGIYISSELGPKGQHIWLSLLGLIKTGKKVKFPFPKDIQGSLDFIKSLIEKHKFRPLIDREYPLDDIRKAFGYVASEQKLGNVIIRMEEKEAKDSLV